ncbi:hypothetical protein CPT03_18250 [Pedobacter ginsengisoli]|uniref:Adhesin domain-containing protein n=1 Tax=Pedobacter ginsengisoli TaxID=363852 RepID=A0A2D1U9I1_9SPHI|nr:hypothetical protein [Pedobacter ginsengisoli]ATP58265.1 hypothetical protein CPT03_18250 [Pedobacter ginsengisoli]
MKNLTGVLAALLLASGIADAQSINIESAINTEVAVNVSQKTDIDVDTPVGFTQNLSQGDDDPMRSKTFTKTFAADNSDKIVLSNQYGSIQVKTWDRKEVKVDVDIKAYSNNEADVQALLDNIEIEAGKSGDQIVFKTKMEQRNGNWGNGSRNGRRWRREVKINYVVYMPAANALTMSQNYGDINMGDLGGALYVKVQYGNFTAQNLNNSNNYISVQYGKTNVQSVNKAIVKQQYGSGLTIGTANTIDIDAQYTAVNVTNIKGNAVIKQQYGSGLTVGSVENLDLDVQYANVNLNTIKGNAKIRQQYNNISISSVGSLDLNAQYTSASIGTLRGDGKFDMQYNKLSIDEVTNSCKSLTVDGGYLGISVNFNNSFNADFDVHTSYASFNYGDRVSARITDGGDRGSTTKNYTGKIGNGGGARVKVKSDYGSVSFK